MNTCIYYQALVLLITVAVCGCDQEKPQTPPPSTDNLKVAEHPEYNQLINSMRKKQAAGLGSGTVKVNGAWEYKGYSYLDAVSGARLLAVDITITNHTPAFDFDDIEIIDGKHRTSYGSDPHITLLNADGKALPDIQQMPPAPGPVRVLLIYGFPKETQSFTLYYWGKNLLSENHSIEPTGWELPFPKTKAN